MEKLFEFLLSTVKFDQLITFFTFIERQDLETQSVLREIYLCKPMRYHVRYD